MSALPLLALLALSQAVASAAEVVEAEATPFVVLDGDGEPFLRLPRDEQLVYRVHAGVGFVTAPVGRVAQTCQVEPYRRSVFADGAAGDAAGLESATIRIRAQGDYAVYRLDSTIEARHLPQDWPRIIYRMTQDGSSKRKSENMYGTRDGEPTTSYRRDTTHGAPEGSRIWKEHRYRTVPVQPVDLLTAVFSCRTLVHSGESEMTLPLLEKDRLWELTLRRSENRVVETGAGKFRAAAIELDPRPWPGEEVDDEALERFEGLFGLHGSIRIWAEERSGIPIRIEGDLPVGPLSVHVEVILESFRGTPADFRPLRASELGDG